MSEASKPPRCESRACESKSDKMKSMFAQMGGKKPTSSSDHPSTTAASPSAAGTALPCPPDRDEIGRHSWTLLHTMAAYYPDNPTPEHRTAAAALIGAVARLYPCTYCAEDFTKSTQSLPPRIDSRKDFSVWMCEQHNLVNTKLGKPVFNCELAELDLRWRDGGERCKDAA